MSDGVDDGWTIGMALATALVALEELPAGDQPHDFVADLRRLLSEEEGKTLPVLLALARARLHPQIGFAEINRTLH